MAAKGAKPRQRRRATRRAKLSRLLVPLVLVVVAFLYWRPLSTYVETRRELGSRTAEVVELRAQKERLERRYAQASSIETLGREARRVGFVRPGERLFIVKGIDTWRRVHGVGSDAGP